MKRLLVLSDLHCGHMVGLTPPSWQTHDPEPEGRTKRAKFAPIQREAWRWYEKQVKDRGPYDVVVVNGDAIDGRGDKSGSTEQITVDRQEQVDMACSAISRVLTKKTKLVMTYGTAYHTGHKEDWENDIAKELGAKIGAHEWIDLEGVVFDFKHHIGSSQVPMNRATALNRAALWNVLWADQGYTPRADVLVRSHVHQFAAYRDETRPGLRLTTPALQGMGSKFGGRRCEGLVSFGFIVFEAAGGEMTKFEPVLIKLKSQVAKSIVV